MIASTCCFTGHRAIPTEVLTRLRPDLIGEISGLYSGGYRHFISGAALGFDTFAAEVVCSLKKELPDIKLWLAVPHKDHGQNWNPADIKRLEDIKNQSYKVEILSDWFYNDCYHARDRWMVRRSSECIAYYTGSTSGGTAYTAAYTLTNGCNFINLFK